MKTKSKLKWLGAAAVALLGLAGTAGANTGTSSYLNIDVTIVQTLSVSVNTVNTSSQTVIWNGGATVTQASTVTVTNDSGYFAEQWNLRTYATSLDQTNGAAGWTIGATPGVEQVELQATFGKSAGVSAECGSTSWTNPSAGFEPALSNTTPVTYTSTVLNDVTGLAGIGPDNGATNKLNAGSQRELCWRLSMPTSTSLTNQQIVPIVVTAF